MHSRTIVRPTDTRQWPWRDSGCGDSSSGRTLQVRDRHWRLLLPKAGQAFGSWLRRLAVLHSCQQQTESMNLEGGLTQDP